jgi:prevent-host-death family protein
MENPVVITATDLRVHARDIMLRARFYHERFLVQTHGKPMAVVLGLEEYSALLDPREECDTQLGEEMAR